MFENCCDRLYTYTTGDQNRGSFTKKDFLPRPPITKKKGRLIWNLKSRKQQWPTPRRTIVYLYIYIYIYIMICGIIRIY